MLGKSILNVILALVGIYFLIFHTEPLPFSHDAIGLPPFHVVHAIFGIILLSVAAFMWHKSKKANTQA